MTAVTVVLPTYNRAALLPRSIASVLAQSHTDLELLVVDDGSTDGTAAAVAAIGDPRVRYVKQAARGGVSRARNRGVELATGAWIAFQDSDDAWQPQKLERQLAAAHDAVLVVTRDRVTGEPALAYDDPALPPDPVIDLGEHALYRLPPCATWLARREALVAAGGFDPQLDCYEDWELGLRLRARGPIALVNEVLVERARTPGSLFSDEGARLRNLRLIVDRHHETLARNPRAWSYYCNALGQGEACFGDLAEARRWFFAAIRARPLATRGWANLLASLMGQRLFRHYLEASRRLLFWAAAARRRPA